MDHFAVAKQKFSEKRFIVVLISVFLFIVLISFMFLPPKLSSPQIVTIEKGESIRSVSRDLKERNIIRSSSLFNLYIQLSKKSTIGSGEYLFEDPENVFLVAERIKDSDYRLPTALVTLTEGMTNKEMAKEISIQFPNFNTVDFIQKTNSLEGYLFPDTYKFNSSVNVDEVIGSLRNNFDRKISSVKNLISTSKYNLEQIIVMASIVEKESTADGRQEVANILWKRYEMNMPLQVDAPFVYTIGKGTADLTIDDLKSDSLYNTYTRTGLTPTAIGNPGLDSIVAAANPQQTQNLYFLTGRDGKMYYAKSFEGHKQNRALYLD